MRSMVAVLQGRSARLGLAAAGVFTLVLVQAAFGFGLASLDEAASAAAYSPEGLLRLASILAAVLADNRVMLPAVALAAVVLHRRGRTPEALALLGALVVTQGLVHGLKGALDLPRPEHAFVPTSGGGFPSGHAANGALAGAAVAWFVRTRVAIAVGAAWTAFVMWGRLGGGAHFLTDVVGGAALGASLALVALPVAASLGSRRVPVSVPVPVAAPASASAASGAASARPERMQEASASRTEEVP